MATTSIALQTESMRKLFVSIAARSGITVEFRKDCEVPHASARGVITLPVPSVENMQNYWCFAFHELGHLLEPMMWSYTDLPYRLPFDDKLVMAVANIIMDNLDERNFWGEFDGVDEALSEGRARLTPPMLKKASKVDEKNDPMQALIYALCFQDVQERQRWMGYRIEALDLSAGCSAKHIMSELRKIKYRERLSTILGHPKSPGYACEKLVRDILAIVDYDPPKGKDSGKEGEAGEGEGEAGECPKCSGTGTDPVTGDTCPDCSGSGKESGEGEGESDGVGGKKGEGEGDDKGKHDASFEEYGDENEMDEGRPEGGGWSGKIKAMTEEQKGAICEAILKDSTKKPDAPMKRIDTYASREYRPWPKNRIIDLESTYSSHQPHLKDTIVKALGDSTVSRQVARYLKTLTTESYIYGQKRGKVANKSVHRVVSSRPGITPSIYKQKNATLLKMDSAVEILCDCSGSMGGSKYAIAAACCVALSDTLTQLQIANEVLGFTEVDTLQSYIFKSFGNKMTKGKLLQCMAHNKLNLYNNADGESLMWAAERLLERPESRKLLIVLSDGSPCGRFTGNGGSYLKKVCQEIEEKSPIDLIGIGIRTTAPQRYYRDSVVVNDTSNLDTVLFKVLRNFLT